MKLKELLKGFDNYLHSTVSIYFRDEYECMHFTEITKDEYTDCQKVYGEADVLNWWISQSVSWQNPSKAILSCELCIRIDADRTGKKMNKIHKKVIETSSEKSRIEKLEKKMDKIHNEFYGYLDGDYKNS